jgi:hypothetical protein
MTDSLGHAGARELMAAAIEGSLPVSQERELAVHLVGCADCKKLYSNLQQAELALRGLAFSHPPSDAVDTAVTRATTVLRGEADPGPGSWGPVPAGAAAPVGEEVDIAAPGDFESHSPPIPIPAPIFVEPKPAHDMQTGELPGAEDSDEPRFVRAILSDPDSTPVAAAVIPTPVEEAHEPAEPEPEPPPPPATSPLEPVPAPVADEPVWTPPPRDDFDIDSPGARPPRPGALSEELTDDDLVLPTLPPRPGEDEPEQGFVPPEPTEVLAPVDAPIVIGPPPVAPEPYAPPEPFAPPEPYAAELADAEPPPRGDVTRRPAPTRAPRRRAGAGPWLAAITVAVILALVALFVFTRSQTGGGKTPTAQEVRERVQAAFSQMRSIKASFTIRRLDLYPVSRRGATMQYSFSDGTTTGRLVFDRAGGFREESATDVANNEIATVRVAQTVGELRTLQGTGAAAKLVVVRNPALGPPDGGFYPSLGSLDRGVGSVAQMIVDASGLEVLGLRKTNDGQIVDVRFDVVPNELTRADRIEVSLDTRNYFPVHIRREISRANGRVLAPESILGGAALQTAFGNRDRILTEDTVITDLVVGDVILPGDFVLDVPQGATTQNVTGSFQRVARADLGTKLHFAPLFPQLSSDYTEQALAVFNGTPGKWGPAGSYPPPDAIFQATYFNGKRTIVITERHMKAPFNITGSPITGRTLPITVTPQTRADKTFFYAWSPEVPAHAYGFLGDVFVMVTGNASADDLVGILAGMSQAQSGATTPVPVTVPPSGSPALNSATPAP